MSLRWVFLVLMAFAISACGDDSAPSSGSDFGIDLGDPDRDNDGVPNEQDVCPDLPNPDQLDLDEDGEGDVCDPDDDGDGVIDEADGCPRTPDPERLDFDGDGQGDACDDDDDNDGVADEMDVCPFDDSDMGSDIDGDGLGDPCDFDIDGDEVRNEDDNCPMVANTAQEDQDEDGLGDGCDDDQDGDTILDAEDNCVSVPNPEQGDLDFDGVGDDCDGESDGDGLEDVRDNCPYAINPGQEDSDMDGVGDACDECISDPNNDADGDGVCGDVDNCPMAANADQVDDDEDGRGTACDVCPFDVRNDDDEDGVCGSLDNCPDEANQDQVDTDRDGLGDACDACVLDAENDRDLDGVCGDVDLCPLSADPDQVDTDQDGLGDVCDICPGDADNDLDGDSVCGDVDNCPEFSNVAQADDDGDGVGDACDECVAGGPTDPDGDARCGVADNCPGLANPMQLDRDQDGLGDACDVCPADAINDSDGDGVCGDLDTCPDVYDPGQSNDDGDGFGNACDDDSDNDGVPDDEDNCPLTPNEDQLDRYGDERGDACERAYFYEDFELGIERWTVGRGEWNVSNEAALSGNLGLVDRVGTSLKNQTVWIETPVIDLTFAERPRVSFYSRFSLVSYGFEIQVMGAEDEVLEVIQVVGPGVGGQEFIRYEAPIVQYAGRDDIRLRLQFRTSNNVGLGVWMDEFRVDEGPRLPPSVLPVSDEFLTLDAWDQTGGRWSISIDGAFSNQALHFAQEQTFQRGMSSIKLKRPIDLRGANRPELAFWMRSDDFDEDTGLTIELRPADPEVESVFWEPRLGASNPYYEQFALSLDELVGQASVEVFFHYRHWSNRRSWVTIDKFEVRERGDEARRLAPAEIWVDEADIYFETSGWGIVEEPLGSPALRSSGFGLRLQSEVRASFGVFDLSQTAAPILSLTARYSLRAGHQAFLLEVRREDGSSERIPILVPEGNDAENAQFERLEIDLSAYAGLDYVELLLVVTTGADGFYGVDVSRVRVGDVDALEVVDAPVLWDFDESVPEYDNVSGFWTESVGSGVNSSNAVRLLSRRGLRGDEVVDHVRFLPAVNLAGLDRPRLSVAVRHYHFAENHRLWAIVRTPDKGTWKQELSRATGQVQQVSSDGFQTYYVSLAPVAGSREAVVELFAVTSGEDLLDVIVDNVEVANTPTVPNAVLNVDANQFYTVFLNGDEVGAGERWLAGERLELPLQIGPNSIAFEVDGPEGGPRLATTLSFGGLQVRSGESGWKSSQVGEDGSIELDWMQLNFDDVLWANVATDGPTPQSVAGGSYLGMDLETGAKFMQNAGGGTRQYFRHVFEVADSDADQVPDAVDLCPQDPTGPERDSNGNGLGDSCDFCAQCANVAYGKPASASAVFGNDLANYGAQYVNNGSASCDRWRADGAGPDGGAHWVEVDLGSVHRVCSAKWYNSTDCGLYTSGTQAWRMTVRESDEAAEVEVGSGDLGNRLPSTHPRVVDFGECFQARFVRFYVDRSLADVAGISELQVFGEPVGE